VTRPIKVQGDRSDVACFHCFLDLINHLGLFSLREGIQKEEDTWSSMGGGALGRKFRIFRKEKQDPNLEEKPTPRVKEPGEIRSSTPSTGIVVDPPPVEDSDVSLLEQGT